MVLFGSHLCGLSKWWILVILLNYQFGCFSSFGFHIDILCYIVWRFLYNLKKSSFSILFGFFGSLVGYTETCWRTAMILNSIIAILYEPPYRPILVDMGVHAFTKGIITKVKVKVITWLEFELAYFEAAIQHFNHYTTGTAPSSILRP